MKSYSFLLSSFVVKVGKRREGGNPPSLKLRRRGRGGGVEKGRKGDVEKGRRGERETRRKGDKEKGRQGERETRRKGDKEKGRLAFANTAED